MAQRSAGKMRHFDDICRLLLTSLVIKTEMRYMFYLADGWTVIPNSRSIAGAIRDTMSNFQEIRIIIVLLFGT